MRPVQNRSHGHPVWLTIAHKEACELTRDGRFRVAAVSVLLLVLGALAAGSRDAARLRNERESLQSRTRSQWEAQPARNPHGAAHYGMYAVKPVGALALVDRGLDRYLGTAAYLEAHYQNPFRYRPAEETTSLARMGDLGAAAVLQLFLPLLICILLFPLIAGERERGTLRQVLSTGVSRTSILAGKAAGATVAIAWVTLPTAVLGSLTLALVSPGGDVQARFLLMLLGYLLYFAFFILVSLIVSSVAPTTRAALLVLLGIWVWNGFLAPVLASDLAERIHPLPSAQEFWRGVRRDLDQGLDGHAPRSQRYAEFEQRALQAYGVSRIEDLPVNIAGLAYLESEAYSDLVLDRHYGAFWELLDKQANVHRVVALSAPLLAVRAWSMGAAGTDLSHHRAFVEATESYRREINRRLNEDLAYESRSTDLFYRASPELWASMPTFGFVPPTAGALARAHAAELAGLAALGVLALAATLVVALRLRG